MDETLRELLISAFTIAALVWLVAIATNILGITNYRWSLLLLPVIAVWGVKIALLVLAPLGLLMEKMRQRLNRKLQKTETDE